MKALKRIEAAYIHATGNWSGADWTHYILDEDGTERRDEDGEPIVCGDEPDCETCRLAKEAAEAAEFYAGEAMTAARAGRLTDALKWAQQAASCESQFGDDPTWGPFVAVIEEAIDGE